MAQQDTLKVLGKIMAEDGAMAKKIHEAQEKGKGGGYGIMPSQDLHERLEIKKADAGGLILCWYGPNGSREIVAEDIDKAIPLIKKFFSAADSDSKA